MTSKYYVNSGYSFVKFSVLRQSKLSRRRWLRIFGGQLPTCHPRPHKSPENFIRIIHDMYVGLTRLTRSNFTTDNKTRLDSAANRRDRHLTARLQLAIDRSRWIQMIISSRHACPTPASIAPHWWDHYTSANLWHAATPGNHRCSYFHCTNSYS